MVVTKKWLTDNKTKSGSWTKPQIMALDIKWPPTKGWMGRVSGTVISKATADLFESKIAAKDYRSGVNGVS